ncbi:FUSC family protein [Eubacterium aggregans]|uniref:FUSC family protein n=1 Tax=Eubacterium aggregans TaxID=81409 RepID=UPI003F372251
MPHLPHIGMRIIKTTIAVFIVEIIFTAFAFERSPFYVLVATIVCIQPDAENEKDNAIKRVVATLIGAFTGAVVLLVKPAVLGWGCWAYFLDVLNAGMICLTIYLAVLLKKESTAALACMVYLSIAVMSSGGVPVGDYIFSVSWILSWGLASLLSSGIPICPTTDVRMPCLLWITTALLKRVRQVNVFHQRVLNQLVAQGAPLSLVAQEPPASIVEDLSILKLKLPVISMGGAALYDIEDKCYIYTLSIQPEQAKRVQSFLTDKGTPFFTNAMVDKVLLIYYNQFRNQIQKEFYEDLRRSPMRNYIKGCPIEGCEILYFSVLDTPRQIDRLIESLSAQEEGLCCRVTHDVYEGRSLLKIMDAQATPQAMVDSLKADYGYTRSLTFGVEVEESDIILPQGDFTSAIRQIRRIYNRMGRMPRSND